MDEQPGALQKFLTDEPWSDARDRSSLLMVLLMAGAIGGVIQGIVLRDWSPGSGGDAIPWTGIEGFASRGFCLGGAVGLALICSRHLVVRVLAAVFTGGASIVLDGLLSGTRPQGRAIEDALTLGAPVGAALACGIHLLRKWMTDFRGIVGALTLSGLTGIQAQSFHRFPHRSEAFLGPGQIGALVFELCAVGMVLGLELLSLHAARRSRERWIIPSLALLGLLSGGALFWALQTMPFTPPSAVEFIAFSADGRTLITAHRGQTLRQWRVEEPRNGADPEATEVGKLRTWGGSGVQRNFATDGRRILEVREDRTLTMRDAATLEITEELVRPGCSFSKAAMSRDGTTIAAVNGLSEIWLWHSDSGSVSLNSRPLTLEDVHPAERLLFSPDESLLILWDGYAGGAVWDIRTGRHLTPGDGLSATEGGGSILGPFPRFLTGHGGIRREGSEGVDGWWRTRAVASPSGTQIAFFSEGNLEIWDLIEKEQLLDDRLLGPGSFGGPIAYSPDGRRIAFGDSLGQVRIIAAPTPSKE